MLHNMVNLGPLGLEAEIDPVVWGTPANFNGFRVLAALLHSSQVMGVSQTFGVEQRAPPMFGRVTITLGIGPHSSYFKHFCNCFYSLLSIRFPKRLFSLTRRQLLRVCV